MLEATRQRFAALQAEAARAGVVLRLPPPEPTSCCGRGCNGCVWEGYYGALTFWLEDAAQVLTEA